MDYKKILELEQEIYDRLKERERAAREAESRYWTWVDNSELSDFSDEELNKILETLDGVQDACSC